MLQPSRRLPEPAGEARRFDAFYREVDAAFVALPAGEHFEAARAATEHGVHFFLEWPPALSLRTCEAMSRLAEEAGVEAGLSRPLRFHPLFALAPAGWRASLILLRLEYADNAHGLWQQRIADAVDLCCTLAGSAGIQRVDAEALRAGGPWQEALAFGLRFHSGSYAQVSIRRNAPAGAESLFAGGPGLQLEVNLAGSEIMLRRAGSPLEKVTLDEALAGPASLIEKETHAFLEAVAHRRAAPVSILDGLNTMRIVERLVRKLR